MTDTGVSLGIKVPDIGIQGEYVHVDFTLIKGDLATVDLFMSDLHSLSTYPVASHISVHRNHPQMVVIIPLEVNSGHAPIQLFDEHAFGRVIADMAFSVVVISDVSVEYARSNSITVHSSTSGRIKVPEHGHRGTSVSIELHFPESGPTKVDLFLWEQDLGEHVLIAEDMHVERDDPQALDIPLQVEPGQYQFVATTGEERTIYGSSNIITVD
ncbi:hypothetical protein JVT61DRAFT_10114 [Boletus reticuloceps]|uniref:Uncharacterized protein n=1 Tax=Boletus reticuloceps TaxID=495285 RepID=A0A8I3ABU2_9AGAM|nr:hypothetical protein JVT61DRAFT_10114 [Boletus reticuloceps]